MMVVGLTGGIASGKSTVAAMLRKANIPVIDADQLAHQLTEPHAPLLKEIAHLFGDDIIAATGALDRKKLAQIVFGDQTKLRKLEAILHPAIRLLAREQLQELADNGQPVAVYMAPLIFEKNLHHDFDKTMLIVTDRDIAIARAHKRDNLPTEHIHKRIDAQMNTEQKIALADEVIENNGTMEDLYINLSAAWKRITGSDLT